MSHPRHLLPFDAYTVQVCGEEATVDRSHLSSAVQTACTFAKAHRRQVTINHPRFGVVAMVHPVGRSAVVVWRPHPVGDLAVQVVGLSVLVCGSLGLVWLVFTLW